MNAWLLVNLKKKFVYVLNVMAVQSREDDFQLLTFARLCAKHSLVNTSCDLKVNVDEDYPNPYGTFVSVLLAVIVTCIIMIVVIGNILVILAVAMNKSLKTFQNLLIASLALVDLSLGIFIIPFSLANQLLGYWVFGTMWCEIYGALDVFLCTSSIINICLISLDRYWSIVRPINSINKRTSGALLYIGLVWICSAFVSIPPLLGWKKPPEQDWIFSIMQRKHDNLTHDQFVEQLLNQLGEEKFRHFVQGLEDTVFPKCKVRLIG